MVFAENIKKYCEANDFTTVDFERHCGLSNGCVSKYSSIVKSPSVRTLQRVAQATGIDMMAWITKGGIDGHIKKDKRPIKGARKKAK